jgi:hypothetical protein
MLAKLGKWCGYSGWVVSIFGGLFDLVAESVGAGVIYR